MKHCREYSNADNLSTCTLAVHPLLRPDLVAFPLRGEVVAIDTEQHKIMISHEAIPHSMDAMTMQFTGKDLRLLKSVEIGDSIEGVLVVSKAESRLETVTVVGKKAND